jgi:hypothetical protein
MESKKINQLATELTPALSDLTIIGDPTTGISKKITLSQMASLFTGTVEEYANLAAFPLVGVADTIYIALDTNILYRWNTGTNAYVELSPNIVSSLVFNDANGFDGTINLVGSVATLTITTALTTGSVGFIGASGALLQDNANFFWDDTNNRLGLGTNAPTTALDVFGSGIIGRLNGTSTNNAYLGFSSAGTNKWSVGNVQSDHRFRIFSEANTSELISVLQTGEFGIGIANPTTKLHIDGGATALIANLDANVSVAKSISYRSDNSNRINLEVSGTESGSNAGANFFLRAYSDAGSLLNTPLTITRATGAATFISTVAANKFNSSLGYTFGTATDGTTGQIATDNTDTFFDYKGSLFFRSALASAIRITITESGAATFINDITITKASSASFIANNTSVSGKSYRLLSADDGTFRIQNTGVLDLLTISSSGISKFTSSLGINGAPGTAYPLEVYVNSSTAYTSSSRGNVMRLYNSNTGSNIFAGIELGGAGASNDGLAGINAVVTSAGSAALTFYTRNSNTFLEKMHISSSGMVGIGGAPNSWDTTNVLALQIKGTALWTFGNGVASFMSTNTYYDGTNRKYIYADYAIEYDQNAGSHQWFTSPIGTAGASFTPTERMRIRNDGNIGIGSVGGSGTRLSIQAASGNAAIRIDADSGQSAILIGGNGNINVDYPGVSNGRFQLDGNGNVYNRTGVYGTISSDLRLKENIVDASSKLNDILKLRVVNFNLISDLEKKKNIGFIAQEMQEIFPSFVYEKDTREFDEEGNIISGYEDSLGVKVGMEFAILVKCIQELKAEIDVLKSK